MTVRINSFPALTERILVLLCMFFAWPALVSAQLLHAGNFAGEKSKATAFSQHANFDGPAKFNLDNSSLCISVQGCNGKSDMAVLHINPNASGSYDHEFDSLKQPTDNSDISLAIIGSDNQFYTVSTLPSVSSATIIPLSFDCSGDGQCLITVRGAFAFQYRYPIILKDKELGTIVELRNDSVYAFKHSASGRADRFEILFDYTSGITGKQNSDDPEILVFQGTVAVRSNQDIQGVVSLYDIGGKLIQSKTGMLNGLNLNAEIGGGVYIVRLAFGGKFMVKKVFLGSGFDARGEL